MSYRLTQSAEADLVDIYLYGLTEFGALLADGYHEKLEAAFELLAEFPLLARERVEIDPPVRMHPVGSHLVVYVTKGDEVLIVRVRHQREDWGADI